MKKSEINYTHTQYIYIYKHIYIKKTNKNGEVKIGREVRNQTTWPRQTRHKHYPETKDRGKTYNITLYTHTYIYKLKLEKQRALFPLQHIQHQDEAPLCLAE